MKSVEVDEASSSGAAIMIDIMMHHHRRQHRMGRWYVEGSVCNSVYSEFRVHEILCTQHSVYTESCVRESCDLDPTHNFVDHEKSIFPDEKELLE